MSDHDHEDNLFGTPADMRAALYDAAELEPRLRPFMDAVLDSIEHEALHVAVAHAPTFMMMGTAGEEWPGGLLLEAHERDEEDGAEVMSGLLDAFFDDPTDAADGAALEVARIAADRIAAVMNQHMRAAFDEGVRRANQENPDG